MILESSCWEFDMRRMGSIHKCFSLKQHLQASLHSSSVPLESSRYPTYHWVFHTTWAYTSSRTNETTLVQPLVITPVITTELAPDSDPWDFTPFLPKNHWRRNPWLNHQISIRFPVQFYGREIPLKDPRKSHDFHHPPEGCRHDR
jgi:hypothetical protein